MKTYSITAARNHLKELIHALEQEGAVQITRHNKVVALLLPPDTYTPLPQNSQIGFWDAYLAFRQRLEQTDLDLDPSEVFANVRDQTLGKEATW